MAHGIVPSSILRLFGVNFLNWVSRQEIGAETLVVIGHGDKVLTSGTAGAFNADQVGLLDYYLFLAHLSPHRIAGDHAGSYLSNGRSVLSARVWHAESSVCFLVQPDFDGFLGVLQCPDRDTYIVLD